MLQLDHLVCEGNISKIHVMSTYEHEEVACRMHGSLSMVDVHYMAPAVAVVVAPRGVTSPPRLPPPLGGAADAAVGGGVLRTSTVEQAVSATCNFLVLLRGHDPDFL